MKNSETSLRKKSNKEDLNSILDSASAWIDTFEELEQSTIGGIPGTINNNSNTSKKISLVDYPSDSENPQPKPRNSLKGQEDILGNFEPETEEVFNTEPVNMDVDQQQQQQQKNDAQEMELEYRQLQAYSKRFSSNKRNPTRGSSGSPLKIEPAEPIDRRLEKATKKAPDMAAFITYQKNKQHNQSVNLPGHAIAESNTNSRAADNAAAERFRTLGHYHGRTVNKSISDDLEAEGINSHSLRINNFASTSGANNDGGAFLQTTTRQLHKPFNPNEFLYDDAERIHCKKARVKFDFKSNSEKELALKRNEIVWVYGDIDKNWYHGELISGITSAKGIFPKNFVEIIDGSEKVNNFRVLEYGHADVLFDINGRSEKELSAEKGDRVFLIKKVDENWWLARTNENGYIKARKGIIPDNFIKVTKAPVTTEGVIDISNENDKIMNIKLDATGMGWMFLSINVEKIIKFLSKSSNPFLHPAQPIFVPPPFPIKPSLRSRRNRQPTSQFQT